MLDHTEHIHLLLKSDTSMLRGAADSPAPGRAPRVLRAPRARTAPNRPKEHQPDTSRFLRKNQRERQPPQIDRSEYKCVLESKRPPVPKTIFPALPQTKKDFLKVNKERVEHMEVKSPTPVTVVSCRGERRDLTYYLEGKKLRESRNFGQVPKYLIVRRTDWDRREMREQEEILRRKEETGAMPGHTQISEQERQTLLKGLKDRWLEVHKEFNILPVLCDTAPKVKRKLQLEQQLAALEKDITLLEANPFIFLEKDQKNENIH